MKTNLFEKMPLRSKLYFGFFAGTLLLLLVGGVSYYNINTINQKIKEIVQQEVDFLIDADELRFLTSVHRGYVKDFVINFGKTDRQQNDFNNFQKAHDRMLEVMRKIDEKIPGTAFDTKEVKNGILKSQEEYKKYIDGFVSFAQDIISGKDTHPLGEAIQTIMPLKENIANLEEGINSFVNGVQNEIHQKTAELSATGKNIQRFIFISIIVGLIASTLLSLFITRSIVASVSVVSSGLEQLSQGQGDLTTRFEVKNNDEIGLLSKNFNSFMEKLQTIIGEVKNGMVSLSSSSSHLTKVSGSLSEAAGQAAEQATSVAAATEEMSQNLHTISAAMEQSSTSVEAVATASEEMTSTINEISAQTSRAREISGKAVARFSETNEKMDTLGQAASEISTVTEAITQISEQTNLLALNATIEAARAGEAGKGFAVVANEIKELARQTAEATIDIKSKINEVQTTTDNTIVDIGAIRDVVQEVNEIILGIASAIEQQAGAASEISGNTSQVATGITEINGNISQSSVVIGEVASDVSKMSSAADDVRESGDTVATNAKELQELAKHLQELVSRFTV